MRCTSLQASLGGANESLPADTSAAPPVEALPVPPCVTPVRGPATPRSTAVLPVPRWRWLPPNATSNSPEHPETSSILDHAAARLESAHSSQYRISRVAPLCGPGTQPCHRGRRAPVTGALEGGRRRPPRGNRARTFPRSRRLPTHSRPREAPLAAFGQGGPYAALARGSERGGR